MNEAIAELSDAIRAFGRELWRTARPPIERALAWLNGLLDPDAR